MSNTNYILTSDGTFMSGSELLHYGVKGMRWGVRRYQNPDGSLTNKGKKRHEVLSSAEDKAKKCPIWLEKIPSYIARKRVKRKPKNLAIPNIEKL